MKKTILVSLLALTVLFLFSGCPDGGNTVPTAVTGVSITNDASDLILTVGGTVDLTAEATPADAADKTVTWSSGDESLATVSASGTVTAVAATSGVIITVTTTDGRTSLQVLPL